MASDRVDPASTGSGRARQTPMSVIVTMRRVPTRDTSHPATGIAARAPKAIPSRARPSVPAPMARRAWTHGMCGYQLASAAPFAKKTKARAASPRVRPLGCPTSRVLKRVLTRRAASRARLSKAAFSALC
jgi:hypothetical protein